MNKNKINISNKIIVAPMAGFTNSVFRRIMREYGAGMVYSEMISANGLLHDNEKTWSYVKIHSDEHPVAIQLFGGDIKAMTQAATIIDKKTPCDVIDINMGCPVKKVLKAGAGCALLNDVEKIENMVRAISKAVKKPVSVKIRAGYDHKNINCAEVAQAAERGGAALIIIHGRTKTDLYGGSVNLQYIKCVKEAVSCPVAGNGDIRSIADAEIMFNETGVDFIMVGRAALGNPWFIRDLANHFDGRDILPPPSKTEKALQCLRHFRMLLAEKDEKSAVLEMRSLAPWYLKGLENIRVLRQQIVKAKTKEEMIKLITINMEI